MYYMDANILRPLTEPYQLSFAEMVGPKVAEWFVSHWWGTEFRVYREALSRHAKEQDAGVIYFIFSENPTDNSVCERHFRTCVFEDFNDGEWGRTTYWICTFANNQPPGVLEQHFSKVYNYKLDNNIHVLLLLKMIFFALSQPVRYKIEDELGKSHQDSSFYEALHGGTVKGTCMILDEKAFLEYLHSCFPSLKDYAQNLTKQEILCKPILERF